MRLVFMGTPEFALPSLQALWDSGQEIVGIFTQPDRPKGRGGKVAVSPVKAWGLRQGIPIFTPSRIRKEGVEDLRDLRPDVCVTAAYGQILSQEILDIPRLGTVNLHASLLPKYRGAAPANFAIIQGETVTGLTTMLTDKGLDTGAILLQKEVPIAPEDTAATLLENLATAGAPLLVETLEKLEKGKIAPIPQVEAEASYYPLLKKEDGEIRWDEPSASIINRIRGVNPWPGAYTSMPGGILKIWFAEVYEKEGQPGEVLISDDKNGLIVACGSGAIRVAEMQAPGGKRMNSRDYLRGKAIPRGTILGRMEY